MFARAVGVRPPSGRFTTPDLIIRKRMVERMVTKSHKYLGNGLYTVAEAAMYCRVSTSVMTRWLFGIKSGRSVLDPEFGSKERFVSFLDLVQTLAIREIRSQENVPLVKFRQAIQLAKEKFQLNHPFARHHCTYLYNNDLVIRPESDRDQYFEASGKQRGQGMFSFVEMYMKSLDFTPDGLANRFRIFESTHKKPVTITLDPHVRFGEPLLPSGYTAMSIRAAILVEGGVDPVAKVYGIPREEVEAAYLFVDFLNKRAA